MRREKAKLYPRRPGLEPGPIRCGRRGWKRKITIGVLTNVGRWLWVPAFAGTTMLWS